MDDRLHILILDDEPIACKRLKPALEKCGYDVETYGNPAEALKRTDEVEFDIIVTDIRMEGIDGIRVLEQVLSKSDHTKVIMITGYATTEMAREALAKGAYDFIAKPFKPNDLRVVISRAAREIKNIERAGKNAQG